MLLAAGEGSSPHPAESETGQGPRDEGAQCAPERPQGSKRCGADRRSRWRATLVPADLWGVPAVAVPARAVAVPSVAVPAGGRDSGSAARRQRVTSPSPSVWPRTGRCGRASSACSRPVRVGHGLGGLPLAGPAWRWQQRAGCWPAVAVSFPASTRNGGRTLAQGLQVEAMRARLEPGAGRHIMMCPGQACLRHQFQSRAGGLGGRLRRFGKPSRLRAATIADSELATIESPRPSRRRRGGSSSSTFTSVPLSQYKKTVIS